MTELELRTRAKELEARLRRGEALTREEQLLLLCAQLLFSPTRRELGYGQP